MIVEMTSLTPRVTLSTAAMPAHRPPTTIATTMISDVQHARQARPRRRRAAAIIAASRYWPSTPMLNRFIRKPMATASAGR